MGKLPLPVRIAKRAANVSAAIDDALADRLAAYLELLARWNRKINLTACRLDPPDDAAVDRLVIEPIIAARHVTIEHRVALDIGSGGGSPALPLKLALPALQLTLLESKVRKAAFLREAVRQLQLDQVKIQNGRLDELAVGTGAWDIATVRGVRLDTALFGTLELLVRPGGRVLAFISTAESFNSPFGHVSFADLVPERQSRLAILDLA